LPDGSVFKGTYDLALRSQTARCLYGFTSAPVSATIEVASSDGSTQVASTSLRESNGWLYLSAAGFTFSSPTVTVKLTQAVTPVPSSTQTASPQGDSTSKSSIESKKITITCTKGKITKKVIALKPTCPSGYKKK